VIKRELSPAMVGSVALHGAVAAALLISWPWARDLQVGSVVPVTIVSNGPQGEPPPAVQDEIEAPAMTEAPVADAPAEVVPPPPTPTPPTPAPAPKAAQTPAPKTPAKPEKSLDFAALEKSLSKLVPRSQPKASSAPKGPTRPSTATTARETTGTDPAAAQAALAGLVDDLQRRWNPNCAVEGGRDMQVKVTFMLSAGGQVAGEPGWQILRGPQSAVGQAAAERAVRAVYAAAPFRNLPREFYGDRIAVIFNAREACST
jgi:outer membrane biosynthesis protein TonB